MLGLGMTMSGMVSDGTVENWRKGSAASGTMTGLCLSLARRRGFEEGKLMGAEAEADETLPSKFESERGAEGAGTAPPAAAAVDT
jgi:hypothetical protein